MVMSHMVRELMDQGEPRNNDRVIQEQYQQWARGFVFEGLRNQRYGQSFCNRFGITDNILYYERDYQTADAYIRRHYVR
jgi:hypothetical protein